MPERPGCHLDYDDRRGACRLCGLASCLGLCPDFAPRVCPLLDRWPYLCRCDKATRAVRPAEVVNANIVFASCANQA